MIIAAVVFAVSGCGKDDEEAGPAPSNKTYLPNPPIHVQNDIENSDVTEGAGAQSDLDESEGSETKEYDPEEWFTSEEIPDEVFERMQGKSYPEGCSVSRSDLRYLKLLYKDTEGNTHEGEMVCNREIADKITNIFRQLYNADYPIEKMVLIDEYDGDDDASMSDNNTSCFNYRVVAGTTKLSKHAMGLAVDLNPRYNPYIHKVNGTETVEPANGEEYADRSRDFTYKIDKDDLAYKLFREAGFSWGGSWNSSKDYQHFQYD